MELAAMEAESIIEEREGVLIHLNGNKSQILRTAHFLKPSLPSHSYSSSISVATARLGGGSQESPLMASYYGWKLPHKRWREWVEKMVLLHDYEWKQAGIHQAVLNSTYHVIRNSRLILRVAEKWCPEYNTFVFSWGRATITLEDVAMLGYSVTGVPVFEHMELETREMKETERRLVKIRSSFSRRRSKKAGEHAWMMQFMETDSRLEHEAFLSLWLSRFVLPGKPRGAISKRIFAIAVRLANGIRVALAPALLASVYRDMRCLKQQGNNSARIAIWSPFHVVQVWIWERFVELRPRPNPTGMGESGMARWHNVKYSGADDIEFALENESNFRWRPHVENTESPFYQIQGDEGRWIRVGVDLREESEWLARCLIPSELVGMGCIEQYSPHLVAMQFGFDQDLPALVQRCNQSQKIAWENYNKPIHGAMLFVPSKSFTPGVTSRYSEWRNQSRSHIFENTTIRSGARGEEDDDADLTFPGLSSFRCDEDASQSQNKKIRLNERDDHNEHKKAANESEEYDNEEDEDDEDEENVGKEDPPCSDAKHDDVIIVNQQLPLRIPEKEVMQRQIDLAETGDDTEINAIVEDDEGGGATRLNVQTLAMELESRILRMENEVRKLKFARFN